MKLTISILIFTAFLVNGCNSNSKQTADNKNSIETNLKENKSMDNKDFTATLIVEKTPQEAFNAINNVRGWWSENIDGSTDKLNSDFFYHYKDIHLCKMKIVELVPAQKVVWLVTDNYFSFTQDKSEWKGTKIIFELAKKENKTEIRFTHHGLIPQYECYKVCTEAWTNYIKNSLFDLVTTGKGQPSSKEDDGFDKQLVEKWKLK